MATTIKLHQETKQKLKLFKEYKNETYDDVIRKLISVAKNIRDEPELSQETIRAIDESRERMARGEYYTEEELWEELGFAVPRDVRETSKKDSRKARKERRA